MVNESQSVPAVLFVPGHCKDRAEGSLHVPLLHQIGAAWHAVAVGTRLVATGIGEVCCAGKTCEVKMFGTHAKDIAGMYNAEDIH